MVGLQTVRSIDFLSDAMKPGVPSLRKAGLSGRGGEGEGVGEERSQHGPCGDANTRAPLQNGMRGISRRAKIKTDR